MVPRLGAAGRVLNKNRAHQTGLDGIDVNNALTEFRRNRAKFSAGLGIEAIRGVTDLGRNEAKHNGNAAQCSPSIAC